MIAGVLILYELLIIMVLNQISIMDDSVSMMDKVKKILHDPYQLGFMASGLALFGFYFFYIRQRDRRAKRNKNILELNLDQLIKNSKDQNICKIVLTQSSEFYREFKNKIITRLREVLVSHKLPVLFNCSPLKMFRAGTEVFYSTLSKQDNQDEKDMMGYFYNSLKCQLIIERTITDIYKIKNSSQRAYLICDNNSLDIKVSGDRTIWQQFLKQQKISQAELKRNYDIVFQIKQNQNLIIPNEWKKQLAHALGNAKQMDQKIKQTWGSYQHFYTIQYRPNLIMEENVEIAIQYIIQCMRPFFKNKIEYQRRQVLVKDW